MFFEPVLPTIRNNIPAILRARVARPEECIPFPGFDIDSNLKGDGVPCDFDVNIRPVLKNDFPKVPYLFCKRCLMRACQKVLPRAGTAYFVCTFFRVKIPLIPAYIADIDNSAFDNIAKRQPAEMGRRKFLPICVGDDHPVAPGTRKADRRNEWSSSLDFENALLFAPALGIAVNQIIPKAPQRLRGLQVVEIRLRMGRRRIALTNGGRFASAVITQLFRLGIVSR